MVNVIVFDLATSNILRRPTPSSAQAVMLPIAMTDGRFYIGVEVLADPKHATNVDASGIRVAAPVDFTTIAAFLPPAPTRPVP